MPFLLMLVIPLLTFAQTRGPLLETPLTQFSCLSKKLNQKFHFYHTPENTPWAVSPNSDFICHDVLKYGYADSALFPRLEAVPGSFILWDGYDPLFYDNDENHSLDVNDLLQAKIYSYGGQNIPSLNPFTRFTAPGKDDLYQDAGTRKSFATYYMKATFRTDANKSFCPTQEHYRSDDPFMKALGDVIGTDTEGLYQRINSTRNDDIILLRESDIKKVWFYVNLQGEFKEPSDDIVSSNTIYFYYPLNKEEPFVKHDNQELYRVVAGDRELYPTHDRKIGCIPKL